MLITIKLGSVNMENRPENPGRPAPLPRVPEWGGKAYSILRCPRDAAKGPKRSSRGLHHPLSGEIHPDLYLILPCAFLIRDGIAGYVRGMAVPDFLPDAGSPGRA